MLARSLGITWRLGVALVVVVGVARGGPIDETTDSFESAGKSIKVERFEPKAADGDPKRPAVLILHGIGGVRARGVEYRDYGRKLAERGYVAVIVHYFGKSSPKLIDWNVDETQLRNWLQTIKDAVTYAGSRPNVDPGRVGLMGFSLGAFISTAAGSSDPRVGAVVDYFGGLPTPTVKTLTRMPPVLILHGDADLIVNVHYSRDLERLLKEKGLPHEIKIYPGQGHGFVGEEGRDAQRLTIEFFDKHLKKADSPAQPCDDPAADVNPGRGR